MRLGQLEIIIGKGDITDSDCQAIVNAANNQLVMGGGVAGMIKRKGGREIETEAVSKGPVKVGESVLTKAGKLKAGYVIHAVTMAMDFKTDEEIIREATYSALLCAQENKITSIAFCALGCGVGGFSYHEASKIMAQEVFRYVREIKNPVLKRVEFILYSDDAHKIFNQNIIEYLGYMNKKISEGPFLTVDGIIKYQGGIVLIKRSNPPMGWAIPGGFVDYGESVEDAVVREVKEETGLDFIDYKQFKVYSDPKRDPRFHTVSVAFIGEGRGTLKADSDAQDAKVFKPDSLPEKIAFDHRKVLKDYLNS